MTTQQSEGALLKEKPLQAIPVGKEGPNGKLEVNGHNPATSPNLASESDKSPELNGEAEPNLESLRKNDAAFSANQALPNAAHVDSEAAKPKGASENDIASDMNKVNMEDISAARDTDMPDAPAPDLKTELVSEEKDEKTVELSPKSKPNSESETQPTTGNEETGVAPADASTINASEEKKEEDKKELKKEQTSERKEDVAMADAQDSNDGAPGLVESTNGGQETTPTKVVPSTTTDDANSAAVDSVKAQSPDATVDATMSDAAPLSAKASIKRDIDSEDEPAAKRAKVEHAAAQDQVHVKTGPVEASTPSDEKPVVNATASSSAPPKKLDDPSLDDSPMTEWQNKQIRTVLAGVKKTKVGNPFRLPVETLWPTVWTDYSLRITNPTDISTMEKRLRGDGSHYASMGEFKQDLNLLVQNAVTFNGEGHDVTLQAKACRDAILARMATYPAVEPPKPERKETVKAHTTRHVEPRVPLAVSTPGANAGAGRASKVAAPSPSQKPVPESPAFALPPGSNGVPLIRRDSTKPDSRAKRPVKPAHPKDLVYDTKRKKKLPLDLRFCDEVLTELRKTKHYEINTPFMQPVDPVALNIPSYHKIIKKPMDLQTMTSKLNSGEYQSSKDFEKDFDLIIKNCKTFNGEEHIVYAQALRLQDLYRAEMSKKDEWMAKHAPVSTAAASHAVGKDVSDSEDAESEPEPEADDERKQLENRMATIQKRLQDEQNKVNEMVNSGTADITDVEIAQSVVAMLQKQLMGERAKLAALPARKAPKAKPAKSKKAGGGGGGAGGKKANAGGGGAAKKGGGTKKAAPRKKMGQVEKEVIIASLSSLDGPLLDRAIDLIKKDTGHRENDDGELELDIEAISEEALVKLYDIAIKANPNARAEKERELGLTATVHAQPEPKAKAPTKSKKNKPMSKVEQERRIQQLNELRAQAGRQASGSQEPMESIEGNGQDLPTQQEQENDSEDEVDSEED
ncbi:uncharacterized protein C8A04DRAFT_13856 [Dichotomopilus funicola]|uniref:Uncharacterized protein n=1 Tax=Dichotomopilus funicola TaxID=1934379 RepID=A0AAN6UYS4_9PEZI|nr:hypothetical protein C8A04DRAFT_13856 [Dichotomopilus funicola]